MRNRANFASDLASEIAYDFTGEFALDCFTGEHQLNHIQTSNVATVTSRYLYKPIF